MNINGIQYYEIAQVMVEDNGVPHKKKPLQKNCHNSRQGERKEPVINNMQCKIPVAGRRSRGKLLTGLVQAASRTRCGSGTQTIFKGLKEQSRVKIMNELKRFTEVDNHEAVKIGDQMVGPDFNRVIFPDAAVRDGVDALTIRIAKEGTLRSFIDMPN